MGAPPNPVIGIRLGNLYPLLLAYQDRNNIKTKGTAARRALTIFLLGNSPEVGILTDQALTLAERADQAQAAATTSIQTLDTARRALQTARMQFANIPADETARARKGLETLETAAQQAEALSYRRIATWHETLTQLVTTIADIIPTDAADSTSVDADATPDQTQTSSSPGVPQ